MKPVHFVGSSRDDLRELPEDARATAGYQLFKVQQGKEPDDWNRWLWWGLVFRKFAFGRKAVPIGFFMWQGLRKPSMCCTFSKNDHRKRLNAISSSPKSDMPIW